MNSEKIGNTNTEIPRKNIGQKLLSFFNKEKTESKYYLLSEHLDKRYKKAWKDHIDFWDADDKPKISRKLGELMEKYIEDPNYVLGVHRSDAIDGTNYKTDQVLKSILNEGIMNLGDASSGAFRIDPDPGKAISPCTNMLDAVILTKSSYKGSTGAILVAIPREYMNNSGDLIIGKENDIYDHNESGYSYIKPEFILGFAPNPGGKDAVIDFVPKEEILDK